MDEYRPVDLEIMPNKKLRKVASWHNVKDIETKSRADLIREILEVQSKVVNLRRFK